MEAIKNRYEFVVLFDVDNGNPNGDPDADNAPRIDVETGYGLVTDVCIKRKIRNYVLLTKENIPGYNILIQPDRALNSKFTAAYEDLGLPLKKKGANANDVLSARDYMCKNYFDVRTFGAVMSTGDDPAGIVRGPVQLNFSRSIDPIFPQNVTITRMAKTTEERREKGETEMGKKSLVPYALYRTEGYISAMLAQKVTLFNEDDLELLWQAIINMFEHDRSAARGKMSVRKLFVFKHNTSLGNFPANTLFEKIEITKKEHIEYPRGYDDYMVRITGDMPSGIDLIEKL